VTAASIMQVENISRDYPMGRATIHALRGVSLSIAQGEFVALMGASGSGKTTLLNILGCLDMPTAGSYLLEDREVSRLTRTERARLRNRRIGFIFQNFNLLPRLSALDNVILPQLYAGKADRPGLRATQILARVGLTERAHHLPNELSGGERQRVGIARALAMNPAIILADEPTGNLDSVTSAEIMALLAELNGEGATILMVTHDHEVAAFAHRILHMRDGQILRE
jgi:putative ABC transport system ATP-binding protein